MSWARNISVTITTTTTWAATKNGQQLWSWVRCLCWPRNRPTTPSLRIRICISILHKLQDCKQCLFKKKTSRHLNTTATTISLWADVDALLTQIKAPKWTSADFDCYGCLLLKLFCKQTRRDCDSTGASHSEDLQAIQIADTDTGTSIATDTDTTTATATATDMNIQREMPHTTYV